MNEILWLYYSNLFPFQNFVLTVTVHLKCLLDTSLSQEIQNKAIVFFLNNSLQSHNSNMNDRPTGSKVEIS